MWTHYHKWKSALAVPIIVIGYLLIGREPDASPQGKAGIILVGLMVLAYLAEEIVWIAKHQGRPCANCSQKIRVKPFVPRILCPHCGHRE
jgi:DNA-directed RNA polymerase subunit RPC12/RpoP